MCNYTNLPYNMGDAGARLPKDSEKVNTSIQRLEWMFTVPFQIIFIHGNKNNSFETQYNVNEQNAR